MVALSPSLSPSVSGNNGGVATVSAATRLTQDVFASARHATHPEVLEGVGGAIVDGVSDADIARIAQDPRVEAIERPMTGKLASIETESWALDLLDQPTLPLSGTYRNPVGSGNGVVIYIFDTGIRLDHAEFGRNGRARLGIDLVGGSVTHACQRHGTLSASAAGGRTTGTAPRAALVDVRIFDCQENGSLFDVAGGVNYVIQQKQGRPNLPMIINMSFMFEPTFLRRITNRANVIDESVRRAVANNITVVASAGNSNKNACDVTPARVREAITVGATTITDERASFSNFGPCVDVFAPGYEVLGASSWGPVTREFWDGTSASSPFVAGLAAAWLGVNPRATPSQVTAALLAGSQANAVHGVGHNPLLAQALF